MLGNAVERTMANGVTDSMDVNSGELRESSGGQGRPRASSPRVPRSRGRDWCRIEQQVHREKPRADAPALPASGPRGARLCRRVLCLLGPRGLSLGLSGGWPGLEPSPGSLGARATERLPGARSPPPAQAAFVNSQRLRRRAVWAVAGGSVPGRWKVPWAFLFGVWVRCCAQRTGLCDGALGRALSPCRPSPPLTRAVPVAPTVRSAAPPPRLHPQKA